MGRMTPFAVLSIAIAFCSLPALAGPNVGGCAIFPADNYWNTPVDTLPVHASSASWVGTIGTSSRLHADWGNVLADNYGIPFVTVTAAQPLVPIVPDPVEDYSDESDPGPYPVPPNAPIEGGPASDGDRHVLVVETTNCRLYELYRARPINGGASWSASSFAKFDLNSNALRPAGWTSADAAGLPIFPGLVRWEEVAAGEIAHAIRFTAARIWGRDAATGQQKYLWPARHASGTNTDPARPPMGARFRLKASFDISAYSAPTQVILRAFKKYGLVLADAGSNWFFQGVSDTNWPDAVFSEIGSIAGGNFEAVDTSVMQVSPDSARAVIPSLTNPPRLVNIATRGRVQTGANVMIAGFIIGGTTPKKVLITARGPSVAVLPSEVSLLMADPKMTLYSGATPIASNNDWQTVIAPPNPALITLLPPEQIPSTQKPGNGKDAAILTTLAPGAYTAIVEGVGGATGLAIVEVFEVDLPQVPLINIATRALVESGANVMIAGFIIQGDAPKKVLLTARGQSVAVLPSEIPLLMKNPMLQLFSGATPIATNDDWQTPITPPSGSPVVLLPSTDIPATQKPGDVKDAAILTTLAPGAYTAIVTDSAPGIAIVEVFAQ